jgi:hypothetical protein
MRLTFTQFVIGVVQACRFVGLAAQSSRFRHFDFIAVWLAGFTPSEAAATQFDARVV